MMSAPLSRSIAKLSRFGLVGATNSLIYALATPFFVRALDLSPSPASFLGYLTVLPFAFFAHRNYTFRSAGDRRKEGARFLISFVAGLLLAVALMKICVDVLGLHYAFGIVAAVAGVPLLTLLVLDRWVFQSQKLK